MNPPRIDCGITAFSDAELRARDLTAALLRSLSNLVRRIRSAK
jgi:hypothetical protein